MRVIIALSQLNHLGGGERCTAELARYLSPRHDVILWTGRQSLHHTFPELTAYPRRTLRAIDWLTSRPEADAVIAQSFGAYLLAPRHPNVVCYLHTLRSRYLTAGRRPDLAARRLLDHWALSCASSLLTNSAFTAARASALYGRRPVVVPPGVDERFFASPARAGDYALSVGRLAPEKGLERLFAWIADTRIPLRVVGAGVPDYVRRLRSLAPANVTFLGPLIGDALVDQYTNCRFLAFLPRDEEFGLAALEAMAAAKPVIAARSGALPVLVDDGATGLLVDSAAAFSEAVRRLIADDAECLRMGLAGREKARAFTWQRFVAGVEDECLRGVTRPEQRRDG